MKDEFKNKVVCITGASSGIGLALTHRFARAGARLLLMDIDEVAIKALQDELKAKRVEVLAMTGDVSRFESCDNLMQEGVRRFGELDVLINNAGITHRSAFLDTDLAVLRRVMEVNYYGAINCTKAALPFLIQTRGTIVVLSSVAGFAPLLGRTGYAAAKHALIGFFSSLRSEVAKSGVHILIVCPGFTRTNIEKNALGEDGKPTDHPQSRVGKSLSAEQVAEEIYQGVLKRKKFLVLSRIAKTSYWLMRIAPSLYEFLMKRSLRSELERS